MTARRENLVAAAFVVGAVTFWAAGDTTVKLLAERMAVPHIMFWRGLISIPLMMLVASASGWRLRVGPLVNPLVLLRGVVEVVTVFCYLFGVANLPIAIANTLVFTSPLWGVALGGLVLGEHLSRARLGAVMLGFVGMLLVTDPFGVKTSFWVVLPLVAALLQATGDLINRRIDASVPTDSITLVTLTMIATGGGIVSVHSLGLPGPGEILVLAWAASLLVGAYLCYIRAFRIGELSFAAPFKYVSIPQTMLLGWLIWDDRPDGWMLAGAALIVMAGVLIVWQDRPEKSAAVGMETP